MTAAAVPSIITENPIMLNVLLMAARAATGNAKVLVTGESGVGKDLLSREIHARSLRADGPFVAVNCAGLTESLLESELFGHAKGSFTGAHRDKAGRLQLAHRGTIFLDEVGEMSLRMQALLLRFLENGEIQPVGADRVAQKVDVRVIAATNRNLSEMVAAGSFREDLLYRLRVIHLHVPPLRERREDIAALVAYFSTRGSHKVTFSKPALEVLEQYRWPGNVRELHNAVEQAIWLSSHDVVGPEHLPDFVRPSAAVLRPAPERRRQVGDELYEALVQGGYSFWRHIYPLFINRDLTRFEMRELVRRGLSASQGSYRRLLALFGMPDEDYQRFLNFLAAHDCRVDYRAFRRGRAGAPSTRRVLLPPLDALAPGGRRGQIAADSEGTRA